MHGVLWGYRHRAWLGLDSSVAVSGVLHREAWWQGVADVQLNERQRKMLRLLLGDFEGKLTSGKWAKICKVSSGTALRDINDLLAKGLLRRDESAGGRSTSYALVIGDEMSQGESNIPTS